jgi:3D (Asp-Asp-Asp) domain-containing protein
MSRQPNGGFIGRENITDNTTASGVYNLSEVGQKIALNEYPPARFTPSRSLRFRNSANAFLTRTPATAGNRKTWTWSGWVKRGALSPTGGTYSYQVFMEADGPSAQPASRTSFMFSESDRLDIFTDNTNGSRLVSTAVFRDISSWYHIVVAFDTTQAIASNRIKVYVNGTQITAFNTANYPALNSDTAVNHNSQHRIGKPYDPFYFDGYMAEINHIDGQALTPAAFGEYEPRTGEWKPKRYTGTYGTNGFYLPFNDNVSVYSLGRNQSGYSNSLSYTDQLDNAYWTKSAASITANTVANPLNGTVDADKLTETATTAIHSIATASAVTKLANGTYTFSVYAKAAERDNISLQLFASGGEYVGSVFDLSAGTAYVFTGIGMSNVNAAHQAITPVGNGWYRCSISVSTGSATSMTPKICLGGYEASYAGVAGSGVFLYGMQLNAGSSPATYAQITDTPISNDWVPNNFSVTAGGTNDSMVDVPGVGTQVTNDTGGVVRGNYCTLNSTIRQFSSVDSTGSSQPAEDWADGNLRVFFRHDGVSGSVVGTHNIPNTGKWYFEYTNVYESNNAPVRYGQWVGITTSENIAAQNGTPAAGVFDHGYVYTSEGGLNQAPSLTGISNLANDSFANYGTGDIIGVAYDADARTLTWYKNNVLITTVRNLIPSPTGYLPCAGGIKQNTGSGAWNPSNIPAQGLFNFGQRPFAYTPPAGHKSICTTNFIEPTIKKPQEHFDIKLYTGNGVGLSVGNTARQRDNYEISRSLRFNSANNDYLQWVPPTVGNLRTWTWSGWIKRSLLGRQMIFTTPDGVYPTGSLELNDNGSIQWYDYTSIASGYALQLLSTSSIILDVSSWYHITIAFDTTQAISSNRAKLYINGVQVRSFSTEAYPSLNYSGAIGSTLTHRIGAQLNRSTQLFNGYMAEINFVDGQALEPTAFGVFDVDGSWQAKRYTGTYGTNGYRLSFSSEVPQTLSTEYLVVGGGGSGSATSAGNGGGGGYTSNGTSSLSTNVAYNVTVGAGGAGRSFGAGAGFNGSSSKFNAFIANGGFGGGNGGSGGGGGAGYQGIGGNGGTNGGNGGNGTGDYGSGTGGLGGTGQGTTTEFSIVGTTTRYSGAGGGGVYNNSWNEGPGGAGTAGTGGAGGGGNGTKNSTGGNGTANLGGGGGGGARTDGNASNGYGSGSGGSGVVIIKIPNTHTATFSSGVTFSTITSVSGFNIYRITATSTTAETVTFSGLPLDYLVIAGGGGGGANVGGGGGAGGYRTSFSTSGGGQPAEPRLHLNYSTAYPITIGAGGVGGTGVGGVGSNGSNSRFANLISIAGGGGGGNGGGLNGRDGGSGGGAGEAAQRGSGTPGQGFNGGIDYDLGNYYGSGGGGGAGAVGVNGSSGGGGTGGAGVASSITGASVTRAGGGGGGYYPIGGSQASGSGGGGGSGSSSNINGGAGTANTGGGGGGGSNMNNDPGAGGAGGSGIVILRIPSYATATFSGGVTSSLSTSVAGFNIYTVTATSTTNETVTFNRV